MPPAVFRYMFAATIFAPEEDKTMYNTVFKKLLDIGDFIGIKGYVFTTQTGEISIHVTELKVLAKSLRPLPIVKEREEERGQGSSLRCLR